MLAQYRRLVKEVDQVVDKVKSRYGVHLECRPGCHSCCRHDLTVFEVEAASIRSGFKELPGAQRVHILNQAEAVHLRKAEGRPVVCPFLVQNCCSIYPLRPIICRTQGLPLLCTDEEGEDVVDFCPVNFSTPGAVAELDPEHLIRLDILNLKLVATNLAYCRRCGIPDAESGYRTPISDLILDGKP